MNARTWSPFQSSEVRDIVQHLTPEEAATQQRHAQITGMWIGITIAGPIAAALPTGRELGWAWYIYGFYLLVGIGVIGLLKRRKQAYQMLCDSEYGRAQGYDASTVTWFSLGLKKKS